VSVGTSKKEEGSSTTRLAEQWKRVAADGKSEKTLG